LSTVVRHDILAFNNFCVPKYTRLGLSWNLQDAGLVPEATMDKLVHVARSEGLELVHWSGMTRVEA
jgi:hypothetical protein